MVESCYSLLKLPACKLKGLGCQKLTVIQKSVRKWPCHLFFCDLCEHYFQVTIAVVWIVIGQWLMTFDC